MSANSQRDQALSILESNLTKLTKLYNECYRSMKRGALLVYARDIIKMGMPSEIDYRSKKEILEVFDAPNSRAELKQMIDKHI